MFTCEYCNTVCATVPNVLKHLKSHGLSKDDDRFNCSHKTCTSTFSEFLTFRKHLYLHVRKVDEPNNDLINEDVLVAVTSQNNIVPIYQVIVPNEVPNDQITRNFEYSKAITKEDFQSDMGDVIGKKLSELYQDPLVTKKNVQKCCEIVEDAFQAQPVLNIYSEIGKLAKKNNMCETDLDQLYAYFDMLQRPLYNLGSEYKRMKYFKEEGTLINFYSYVILNVPMRNSEGFEEQTSCRGYFFKIEEILTKLFTLPGVYKTVKDFMQDAENENENILSSYLNGESWKKKKETHKGKFLIPLALFIDDFEPNNCLGSHATNYKIGGVYFSIPALPIEISTELKNIFVAGLHFADDRNGDKNYGFRNTMKPIIESLRLLLDEGITVQIESEPVKLYFILAYIHGDNLGLNEILGFAKSFSGKSFCRFCKAQSVNTKHLCVEQSDLLRNKTNYEADLNDNNFKKTGVHFKCCFQDVGLDYDVTENSVVDVMHDFLEGISKYVTAYLLLDLICLKTYFSIESLNYKLQYFDYGPNDSGNKPTLFELKKLKNLNVKMSASEMLCFVRYAPLIFGDLVPEGTKSWEVFLMMREILFIIISPAIKKESIDYLSVLIENFNQQFQVVFNTHLRPKFHFLTHYPSVIRKSGPPVQYWVMRQEAKHKITKSYTKVNANNVNLLFSVATKHQMQISDRLLNEDGFAPSKIVLPCKTKVASANVLQYFKIYDESLTLHLVKKVDFNFVFKEGGVIVTGFDVQGFPDYAMIDKIAVDVKNNNNIFFLCHVLTCDSYDSHFQSHSIVKETETCVVNMDSICLRYPLHCTVNANGKTYVAQRCAL